MAQKASSTLQCSASQARKSNKPLMEKRRRARINDCLTDLKCLVLEAMKKDSSQYSKLEKADILEMTVKHLRNVQRQQYTSAVNTHPDVINKYRAGFNECATEVTRCLGGMPGLDADLQSRLMSHLAGCMQRSSASSETEARSQPQHHQTTPTQPIHVQIPATSPSYPTSNTPVLIPVSARQNTSPAISQAHFAVNNNTSSMDNSRVNGAVKLVPTTLPTGQVAFLLPSQAVSLAQNSGLAIPVYTNSPSSIVSVSPAPSTSPVQTVTVNHQKNTSKIFEAPVVSKISPPFPTTCGQFPLFTASTSPMRKEESVWRPW